MTTITISNNGQEIEFTNYWDSEHARRGYVFLSWNAGAGRLLIPDSQGALLPEMKSGKYVIVSRGPWIDQGGRDAVELLFEDGTDSPFALHLVAEQCDRMIPATDQGGGLVVTAWTRAGEQLRLPAKYRKVDEIPCLAPWKEH